MIKKGSVVKIVYCRKLQDMGLLPLVCQIGTVTECRFDNKHNPGAFVLITNGISKGEEWFVPLRSLQTKEVVKRLKSENILKTNVEKGII